MRRNWQVIFAIKDYWLRVAMSLARDPNDLARFKAGWPQCFDEGEDTGPLRIPLSVLRAAVDDYYARETRPIVERMEFARCFWLTSGWESRPELELPLVAFGQDQEMGVPQDIANQFVGQMPENLIRITWNGQDYVVIWAEFETPPGRFFKTSLRPNDQVNLREPFKEPPHLEGLGMVLAQFINLDA